MMNLMHLLVSALYLKKPLSLLWAVCSRFAVVSLLVGCTVFNAPPAPQPTFTKAVFVVELVDTLPNGIKGLALCNHEVHMCRIQVLKSEFPYCLTHEIIHVFDPKFHKGTSSIEYCDWRY